MKGNEVVIGIGNIYRRDDGLGPAVASLLVGSLPGVEIVETDGEATRLLEFWTGARIAVVVDAVRVRGGTPGRIHRFDESELAVDVPGARHSHAVRLGDVVALARVLDRLPERLVIFAVEVTDTGYGLGLSAPVAAASATVANEIARLLGT
ncbi:hydrogenase maturation protease [Phytohabitans aurantiacus]|uniref:Peptidase M52 n=1 Tax=Phytohabitans aurantiacus TaxID=3016789 RepID=A0ABQ5QZN0_9ACTN|nr:hydrogenase maturation protease [Phytohabitans aurantiacus]GLH99755.1 peptidase M52 [Phytohabitans aurantiacus]